MKKLEQILFDFLTVHYERHRPLLLGLSGGPDSLALFHLLLLCKERMGVDFAVAHIDHNWRKESTTEAKQLEGLAEEHGIPFHLKSLDPSQFNFSRCKGNLEAICRSERLAFFQALCQQHNYQAVMLGHHAGDHAETVLKRLFEGANLTALAGLAKVSIIDEVPFWRPLLHIKKTSILKWLTEKGLAFFTDPTNVDVAFLRAKMRLRLIPWLSKEFGKEVSAGLCNVGNEALELQEYVGAILQKYLLRIQTCPRGLMLDLSNDCPSSLFEIKHLVRQFVEKGDCVLSREQIQIVSRCLINAEANHKVSVGNQTLFVDRRQLFLFNSFWHDLPSGESISFCEGNFCYREWTVSVEKLRNPVENNQESGWMAAWKGSLKVFLPEGVYRLGSPSIDNCYGKFKNTSLDRWWTTHKVPAFLRNKIPVIWKEDCIQVEFLSPQKQSVIGDYSNRGICVTLTINASC